MRKADVLLTALWLTACGSDEPVADDRQNEGSADAATRDATVDVLADATADSGVDASSDDASTEDASVEDASARDASAAADASSLADAAQDAHVDLGPPVRYADVAPIFGTYCIACHAPGGAAPFSLDNYADAAANAASAYFMASSRQMPPAAANDPSLGPTSTELATLLRWVNQGTPES